MNELIFETSEFSTPISHYIRMIMQNVLVRWLRLLVLPIIACLVLAIFISYKFLLVALMAIFLIIPLVLMLVYFNYSSTQEAQIAILKKRLLISKDGIKVYFTPILRHKYDANEENVYFAPKECFISRNEVVKIENIGNNVVIYLKGNKTNLISIPIEYVKGNVDEFLAYILQYNN